jgi:hypothetical protein
MAVVVVVEVPGMTQAQADVMLRDTDLFAKPTPGLLVHAEGADEGGRYRVVDIWESVDAFQAFLQQRILPEYERRDVTGRPQVTTFEAHHLIFGPRP